MDDDYYITNRRRYVTLGVAFALSCVLLWTDMNQTGPFFFAYVGLVTMCTFFHEIGHTLSALVFAVPAFPSFDFQHGGGMTYTYDRIWPLQIVLLGVVAYGVGWIYRRNYVLGIGAGVLAALYAVAALTTFHEALFLFMGHGGEILFGSFILWRVLADRVPPRPLELEVHAAAGCFLILSPIKLSWGLIFDPIAQDDYFHQKALEGFGDFTRLADYFGSAYEAGPAWFCIFFALVCPAIVIVLARYDRDIW